ASRMYLSAWSRADWSMLSEASIRKTTESLSAARTVCRPASPNTSKKIIATRSSRLIVSRRRRYATRGQPSHKKYGMAISKTRAIGLENVMLVGSCSDAPNLDDDAEPYERPLTIKHAVQFVWSWFTILR